MGNRAKEAPSVRTLRVRPPPPLTRGRSGERRGGANKILPHAECGGGGRVRSTRTVGAGLRRVPHHERRGSAVGRPPPSARTPTPPPLARGRSAEHAGAERGRSCPTLRVGEVDACAARGRWGLDFAGFHTTNAEARRWAGPLRRRGRRHLPRWRGGGAQSTRERSAEDPPPRESVGEVPESARAVGARPRARAAVPGIAPRRRKVARRCSPCDDRKAGPLRRRRRRHLPRCAGKERGVRWTQTLREGGAGGKAGSGTDPYIVIMYAVRSRQSIDDHLEVFIPPSAGAGGRQARAGRPRVRSDRFTGARARLRGLEPTRDGVWRLA
jgi:hypothetical protein